jgi:3-carboxy-cis,cis-muconate cycloisomerase
MIAERMPPRSLLSALTGDAEIETLLGDAAQVAAIVRFEIALAATEAELGMVTAEAAEAIAAGLAGFEPDWNDLASGIGRDGVVVPALVAQLRQRIGPPHSQALHHGATSQDVIDTALVLQLDPVISVLLARLAALDKMLARLDARFGRQNLMAQTRMQQALPFTVGAKLETWRAPLQRHAAALMAARESVLVIQLGGPIGDRSSFAPHGEALAAALARRLGLGAAPPWHSARDPLVSLASVLALVSGTLGKIGADVALMVQNEVGTARLAGGGRSSAMAHKSNPVNAEVLVALARYNAGLAGLMQQAMIHENERSGAAWTLEWLSLPNMAVTTGASLRLGQALLEQLDFPSP